MAVKTKQDTDRVLQGVTGSKRFYSVDGCVYNGLNDMALCLAHMDAGTFSHHVNSSNNDFSNWVKDILHDEKLASDLTNAGNATVALKLVRERITQLKKRAR